MDSPRSERRALRGRLVRRLRARQAEIEQASLLRVSSGWFDRTGSDDPQYVAGLRAAAAATLDYALVSIERWQEQLAPVPAEAIEQARRAARIGVGLDTVLRRYFAGHAVLVDFVMHEAERGVLRVQEPVLREVLAITAMLLNRVSAAVSGAYNQEAERGGAVAYSHGRAAPRRSSPQSARASSRTRAEAAASRALVTGVQRERVLAAIVQVVAERRCAWVPIGMIAARARVSTATFYQLFPNGLDDGLAAIIDLGLERTAALAAQAFDGEEGWRDGTRAALAAVLAFLDSEPDLARVWLVHTLGASPVVVDRRTRAVQAFRRLVVARVKAEVSGVSPLAAEGVLASVMEILRARLSTRPQPLIGLVAPLMGLIVEHVEGPDAAAQEALRAEQLAEAIQAEAPGGGPTPACGASPGSRIALPASIANPTAYRLRECVLHLDEHPHASNRAVGAALGIVHKSQVSKLLAQLESEQLASKSAVAPGGRNEWQLTRYGHHVAQALSGLG